jgi:hypothetical protein
MEANRADIYVCEGILFAKQHKPGLKTPSTAQVENNFWDLKLIPVGNKLQKLCSPQKQHAS